MHDIFLSEQFKFLELQYDYTLSWQGGVVAKYQLSYQISCKTLQADNMLFLIMWI
jgi:hypothetical protein